MEAPEPFGVAEYCAAPRSGEDPAVAQFRVALCDGVPAQRQALTATRRAELAEVQGGVNAAIAYRSTTRWEPMAAEGDCKTYAARKVVELLRRGWPAGALRIATAFIGSGPQKYRYHAVVLVDTDAGTLVLDNRRDRPVAMAETDYIWMTAQSHDGRGWTRLAADPVAVRLALARNQLAQY